MRQAAVWGVLWVLAVVLVVAGFQGSAGRLLACLFTPQLLTVD
jgi:hypothetical protein